MDSMFIKKVIQMWGAGRRREILFCIIAAAVMACDQLAKGIVAKGIPLHQEIFRLSTIFSITYSQNRGASFGIMQGKIAFLIWFSVVVLIFIAWHLRKMPAKMVPFAALIAGGAVSNLIDRVNLGYVVDYVNFLYVPTFNIADLAITAGTAGVGYWIWRRQHKA